MTVRLTLDKLKPSDLPSPPQVALEIMHACARNDLGSAELSRLAASDSVLTAELLRVANSPYFGPGHEIASIARAITVLGHKTLRNLALCLTVRDAMHREKPPGFDSAEFWEDALLRAVCARLLGRRAGLDRDDCFTAGILQDFGLLVMLHLDHAAATGWPLLRRLDPDARLAMEFKRFGMTHDAVAALLAEAWDLPDDLGQALGTHHYYCAGQEAGQENTPGHGSVSPLARTLYAADWMTAVFRVDDCSAVLERCRVLIEQAFGIGASRLGEMLIQAPEQVAVAAAALGLRVRRDAALEHGLEAIRETLSVR